MSSHHQPRTFQIFNIAADVTDSKVLPAYLPHDSNVLRSLRQSGACGIAFGESALTFPPLIN